jgi:hypothetical protein
MTQVIISKQSLTSHKNLSQTILSDIEKLVSEQRGTASQNAMKENTRELTAGPWFLQIPWESKQSEKFHASNKQRASNQQDNTYIMTMAWVFASSSSSGVSSDWRV